MKKEIYYDGTNYNEFKKVCLEFFNDEYLHEVLGIIDDNKDKFLDEEEKFAINVSPESNIDSGYHKLISNTHYHINLKGISILFFQIIGEMIIQSKLKKCNINEQELPILPTLVELKRNFNKLCEESVEFCITKEIGCRRNEIDGWNRFINVRRECVNNHLYCTYNHEGKCKLTEKEFEKLLNTLIEKNIICKKNGSYQITF